VSFWGTQFRRTKGAIKLHTLFDLRGNIPTFIQITDGKTHDVTALDEIVFESSAFYVMDRGYIDFIRLFEVNVRRAFFVIRAKNNLSFQRVYSSPVEKETGLRCDQTIRLTGYKSGRYYPKHLRRVKYFDKDIKKTFVFLTKNFEISTWEVAMLYKNRWKIKLFFKWIKQQSVPQKSKHFGAKLKMRSKHRFGLPFVLI